MRLREKGYPLLTVINLTVLHQPRHFLGDVELDDADFATT